MTDNIATDKLLDAAEEAAGVILDLMRGTTTPLGVKLEAARTVLNCGELVSRMTKLEHEMESRKWSLPG
jgi:hypothetical protein